MGAIPKKDKKKRRKHRRVRRLEHPSVYGEEYARRISEQVGRIDSEYEYNNAGAESRFYDKEADLKSYSYDHLNENNVMTPPMSSWPSWRTGTAPVIVKAGWPTLGVRSGGCTRCSRCCV